MTKKMGLCSFSTHRGVGAGQAGGSGMYKDLIIMKKGQEPGWRVSIKGVNRGPLSTKDNGRSSNKLIMLRKETDIP